MALLKDDPGREGCPNAEDVGAIREKARVSAERAGVFVPGGAGRDARPVRSEIRWRGRKVAGGAVPAFLGIFLFAFPARADVNPGPTVNLTDVSGAPFSVNAGAQFDVFEFTIDNADTNDNVHFDSVCVSFNDVSSFTPSDLTAVTLTNSATGESNIVPVNSTTECIPLINQVIPPLTTSAVYVVAVVTDINSDGAQFTVSINNSFGFSDDTGTPLTNATGASLTTGQITIPVFSVSAKNIANTRFLISANSDVHPIFGIKLGTDPQLKDHMRTIIVDFENIRNFVPGGGVADDFGDLEYAYVFMEKSGDHEFSPTGNKNPDDGSGLSTNGDDLVISMTRVEISQNSVGTNGAGGSVKADTYRLTMNFPANVDVPSFEDAKLGPTVWVAIETNRRFSDDPFLPGVGAGDAWRPTLVSVTTEQLSFSPGAVDPVITEVAGYIDSGNIIVPIHISDRPEDFQVTADTAGSEDGKGLDFLEYTPIFGFHMLGGDTFNVVVGPQLERIQLQILDPNNNIDLMGANSPLRPINNSRLSGIQLRKNREGGGTAINALENADGLVPLDMSLTTYQNGPGIDTLTLVFTPSALPSPHVKPEKDPDGNPLTNAWDNLILSASSGNLVPMNNEFLLGVLAGKNAKFGDTLEIRIPPGGVKFNNGVTMDTTFSAQSKLIFGVPVLPADLITSGQVLGESSPPTPVLRLKITGNNHGESLGLVYVYFIDSNTTGIPQLNQTDFLDHDFDGLPFTNTTEANGSSLSSVAVYRDMNGNALFEEGIDSFIPFDAATLGPLDGTRFINPGTDVDLLGGIKALLVRMYLDTNDPNTAIPAGDTGVFFICVRSSGTIDPNDRFFAVLGDLDAVHDDGEYVDAEPAGVWALTDYGWSAAWTNQTLLLQGGDIYGYTDDQILKYGGVPGWRREDHFRSSVIRGEVIEKVILSDLTTFAQTVFPGESVAVFGFNIEAAPDVSLTVDSLAVVVSDAGTIGDFSVLGDLNAISTDGTSGVAIYEDNGNVDGVFDPADQLASLVTVDNSNFATEGRLVFQFSGIPIPTNDIDSNAGNDFYVVILPSSNITFKDDFVVGIPERALGISGGTLKQPNPDTTQILTAGLPVTLSLTSETEINTNGNATAFIGINAADQTNGGVDGGVTLLQVKVSFTDVGGFSVSNDLANLANDSTSGVALYRDNGDTDGVFDANDQFVTLASAPTLAGNVVTLQIAGAGDNVPDTDNGSESGPDWWIVLKASLNADVLAPDSFLVGIASGGLQWSTVFVGDPTITSDTIIFTGIPPSGITSFRPSNILSPARDSVSLRLILPIEPDSPTMVVLYKRDVTSGETVTSATKNGVGDDTFTWFITDFDTELEYGVRVFYSTTGGTATLDLSEKLIVDSSAPTPGAPNAPTSTTATTISLNVVADLTPASGGDPDLTSENKAKLASENNEGFSVLIRVFGPNGEEDTPVNQSFSAQTSDFDQHFNINLFNGGNNNVVIYFTDDAGNVGVDTITIAVGTGGGGVTKQTLTYVDAAGKTLGEPVFRYSPTNNRFGFQFSSTLSEGNIEIFNAAGDRLRVIPATSGSNTVWWDGRNDQGTLLRNGVYVIRVRVVPITGGGIEETRTIFLLK
ncbi:MAG: hypothetical protein D6679_01090 [Candidatus Hydrogenedentota bacterium]|nr:MAG: hypothetical protein D6679_01090 [Candidatus Hydrogenedentota bacterium]